MNNDQLVEGDIGSWVLDNNNALVIYIPKLLDANEAVSFRQAFEYVCESRHPPSRATLNFSRTRFLDSGGIGALASIIKMSKINGIDLTVSRITTQVYSILKMTKLDSLLRIEISEVIDHENVTEAPG
jgi:anti-anti-sigma factor